MPAPGQPVPELLIARLRTSPRALFWSALLLIAVAGATGYFAGNLPSPYTDVMLFAGAGCVVLVLVVIPFIGWLSRRYTITTRRVIVTSGLFSRTSNELTHARGYTVTLRRGPLQRLWGGGNLTLSNGVDDPLKLVNIAHVRLVHEVLVDQVEVNQILAHRDAQSGATGEQFGTGPTAPQF